MKTHVFVLSLGCLFALAGGVLANSAPVVANVTAVQRTDGSRLIDICYDLTDADGDRCTVSVAVSSDNGATWTVQAASMTGALGPGIPPGNGRQIVWDAGKDLPGAYGTDYKVKITADDGKKPDDKKPKVPADIVFIPGGEFLMGDSFDDEDEGGNGRPVHSVYVGPFRIGRHEITNAQYCDFLNSSKAGNQILVTGTAWSYKKGTVYSTSDRWYTYPYVTPSPSGGVTQISYADGRFRVGLLNWAGPDMSNDPLLGVTWHGAVAYCNWRSQQEGYDTCYDLSTWTCDFSKRGYRLPTEAEWEYAARGGLTGKRFPWGDTITHSQANYYSDSRYAYDVSPTRGYRPTYALNGSTSPVGSFPPNGYGLYDMAGNVREWCNDWYDPQHYYYSPYDNPTGPRGGYSHVSRDGSFSEFAYACRVSSRTTSDNSDTFILGRDGFRVVLHVE